MLVKVLTFTSVYFFELRLFNGLRPIGVKISQGSLDNPQRIYGYHFSAGLRVRSMPNTSNDFWFNQENVFDPAFPTSAPFMSARL
jgi:hypothetical protein